MAEQIIREYILKTENFKSEIKALTERLEKLEKGGKKAGSETKKGLEDAGNSANKTTQKVNQLGGSFESLTSVVKKASIAFAGLFAVNKLVGEFKNAINVIKTFDQSVQDLSAITGASGAELDKYKNAAIEMGKGVQGGASATIEAFKLIGSAKPELLSSADALISVTDAAITLSKAAGMDLPQAATALTDALNQFGAPAEDAGKFINVLAAGSKFGAVEISNITEALLKFGAAAKTSNVSIEESTALIEALGEKGLKGAEAGTAIRNVLLKIGSPDALPKDAQESLERLGISFQDLTDKQKPLADRFDVLKPLLKDQTALIKVFGTENVIAATNILQNTDRLRELTGQVTDTNTAYEQAGVRAKTLNEAFNRLKESYNALILSFNDGTGVSSKLAGVLGFLADNLSAIIKTAAIAATTFITVTAATKIATFATAAYRTITIALAGAKAAMTGNTLRAAAAQRVLGMSFAATPWGFIITAITTIGAGLFFMSQSTDEASESQSKLSEEMQKANEKMEEQKNRIDRLTESLNKFSGNKAALSVEQLKQAITDIDAELASLPGQAQRFTDNIKSQAFVLDQATGKLVENTEAEKVYSETQEEATKRQNEYISSLKEKKTALEAQLIAQEKNLDNAKSELTLYQKLQAELKAINERMTEIILKGGIVSQKDITRALELEKIFRELPLLINAIKTGVPDIVPDVDLSEDELKALEANLQRGTQVRNKSAEEDLQNAQDYLEKKLNAEIDYNLEREQLERDYNEFLNQQRQQQLQNAQDVLSVIGNTINQIGGLINQVYDQQQQKINDTLQAEINAINKSTLSQEGKQAKIDALQKKAAKEQYDLQVQAFKVNQGLQIANAAISTAQAVVAGLAAGFSAGGPAGIALGPITAALAGAVGAVQIGLIAAQKPPAPPAFEKGTDFVQRGKNKPGVDTIPAYLNEGEAVIPTDKNRQYPGLAKAWIGGKLESYVNNVMLAPKLAEIERKAEERMMSKIMQIQGEKYDDMRMYMATTEGNMYLRSIAKAVNQSGGKKRSYNA
jgi:TP901 family phage tail tape measure protein